MRSRAREVRTAVGLMAKARDTCLELERHVQHDMGSLHEAAEHQQRGRHAQATASALMRRLRGVSSGR